MASLPTPVAPPPPPTYGANEVEMTRKAAGGMSNDAWGNAIAGKSADDAYSGMAMATGRPYSPPSQYSGPPQTPVTAIGPAGPISSAYGYQPARPVQPYIAPQQPYGMQPYQPYGQPMGNMSPFGGKSYDPSCPCR